ncbi:MAG: class I SAM-dependent methyltransferase [Tissierellales bacterium]|nr:class I SAM-dependent methyltransferase [Tissierellales bacterium]
MKQVRQSEWHKQWEMLRDDELFLFTDWIYPNTLEDFTGKDVLECGCGGGQHTSFLSPYVKSITGVDLNTIDIAAKRCKGLKNVKLIEDDIATIDLKKQFDIVFSIGVIHHTDNPDKTVANLKKHVKSGGKLILWVYAKEGNFLARNIVEPFRKLFLKDMNRKIILFISKILTLLMYFPIYTIYLFPLKFLPYYEYFANFRKMSFCRNALNVFDKLNAPQVEFISRGRITKWFDEKEFKDVHISSYVNVSWRGSGEKI